MELFFEQKADVESINKSNRVVFGEIDKSYYGDKNWTTLNNSDYNPRSFSYVDCNSYGREYYSSLNKMYTKYAPIKKELLDDFSKMRERHLGEGKTLAVLFREEFSSDFQSKYVHSTEWKEKLSYHPIGMNIDDQIEFVDKQSIEWTVDYIFICSEHKETIEKCKLKFGEKLVFIDRKRRTYESYQEYADKSFYNLNTKEDKIEEIYKFKDYLSELYIASTCEYFIGPHCSGTLASLIFNGGKYSDYIIIDNTNANAV